MLDYKRSLKAKLVNEFSSYALDKGASFAYTKFYAKLALMDFKTYLQATALDINQEMEIFFQTWNKEVENISPKLIPLNQAFVEACEGGKRLRGALVKLGYELTGAPVNSEILKASVAIELFQTAILAHDDIIDKSPLRRGKPTLYKALGDNHYGMSQAICLGDIGFFLGVRLITQSDFGKEEKNLAIQSFSDMVLETALGEILDIELPHLDEEKLEQDVVTIFRLKTAKYTIVAPLQLGAVLGGGGQKLLEDISKFGENLGIAFQIQDDLLGVFGDEETIGKSVTSDIEEGKLTLLSVYGIQQADSAQKAILDSYYGKGEINQEQLEQIRDVFIKTGALDYAQKEAEKYVSVAKKIIPEIAKTKEHINLLTEMADFLVKRSN